MTDSIPGDGTCPVPSCTHNAQRNQLMCRQHWFSVSAAGRARVNKAWRAFQDGDASLGELREAQEAAIKEAS